MPSITNLDINNTSLTKDKYHILLIYVLQEDGSCEGGYYEDVLNIMGGVSGNSFQEMCDEAYESLEEAMEGENNIPFNINNIKESV
ncbi:unnamed protein product, partial [Rotaria sp. Silwood1]